MENEAKNKAILAELQAKEAELHADMDAQTAASNEAYQEAFSKWQQEARTKEDKAARSETFQKVVKESTDKLLAAERAKLATMIESHNKEAALNAAMGMTTPRTEDAADRVLQEVQAEAENAAVDQLIDDANTIELSPIHLQEEEQPPALPSEQEKKVA